jgi:hypothetical protein
MSPYLKFNNSALNENHSGSAVSDMNRLRPFERWDRGFESHSKHGCLCAFILYLCCSVCR